MELDVTVEADNTEEAEAKVITALDPISVSLDITDGPNEILGDEDDDEEGAHWHCPSHCRRLAKFEAPHHHDGGGTEGVEFVLCPL